MFARPLTAFSQDSLTSQFLGRFMSRPAPVLAGQRAVAPAANDEVPVCVAVSDDLADLAQRVRESGEW